MELFPPQQAKADRVRRSCFQVLDLGLVLESDSESFRRLFCRDYFRFEASGPGKGRSLRITYLCRSGDPLLSIDGHHTSLQGHPDPDSCAYLLVLEALYARLDGFIVLHAGVVEKNGRALIIAGAPGSGKSTLVLGLLDRGYTFFSDDICPLGESTGLVHPFPRSPWARPSAAGRRGAPRPLSEGPAGKIPVDIESMGARIGRFPARPACIFILDSHRPEHPFVELVIAPKDGRAAPLFSKLASMEMEGVSLERLRPAGSEAAGNRLAGNSPSGNSRRVWRLQYPKGMGLTCRIRDLLAEHDGKLWDVFREDAVHPDFSKPPAITAMTPHEAAFLLLRGLKHNDSFRPGSPGPGAARKGDGRAAPTAPGAARPGATGPSSPGSPRPPGRLFFALCKILGGIACHRLRASRLEEMLRLVTRAFEEAP